MKNKAAFTVALTAAAVLAFFLTAAQCEDKSVERPGGKGYVLCNEAYIEMNARHEVSKCMLAAPLTYDVYGGTDVCPKNGVIKFDERGRVVGCAMVKQKKRR